MIRLAIVVIVAGVTIGLLLRIMLSVIDSMGITPLAVAIGFSAVAILQMATIWYWHDTQRILSP